MKTPKAGRENAKKKHRRVIRDVDDELKKKTDSFIQCYDDMKSVFRLVKEKNDKVTIEYNSIVIEYQNRLKKWNDICNENKILQEKISEVESLSEMNKKIKQEIYSLNLVYTKNISQISELKNEKTNSSQISFDKLPLNLDLDDGYFGFDSVTVSQSEIHMDSRKSYRSFYSQLNNVSTKANNTISSLFTAMDRTNISLETEIRNLNSVKYQIIQNSKTIHEQFDSILKGDQDAIDNILNKKCIWEEIKSNHARHLSVLESNIISLGNRVKSSVRVPTNMVYHNYANWYLQKLSIEQLFNIWSKMFEWTQSLEKIDG